MIKKVMLFCSVLAFSILLVACKPKVNEDAVPEIVVNNTLPTAFEVGDTEPDWTTYFVIEDENDGSIPVTSDLITENVDMSTAGVYTVRVDVYNSVDSYNFYELTIEVESDIEITVDYVLTQGVVGNTYKFEGVEVVYKTNDEYGLYIYDGNTSSDVNYFYITAFEETLSDAMYDINVGDIIDIAGELVLYRGNQQPRFTNVSIIEKTGTANNPHIIDDCVELSMAEYWNLPWDTTDTTDTTREAWKTFGQCYDVQGVLTDVDGYYYSFDPIDDSMGMYAWAYGENTPIADFEDSNNDGKAVTVRTFFYNMHTVSSPPGDFVRSAMIDVTVHTGLTTAISDIIAASLVDGSTMVSVDMTLPTSGTGYTVAWETSDASIVATDGTVTRAATNQDVTLTYTITEGTETFRGQIMVTVVGTVAPPTVAVVTTADLELDLNATEPDWTTYFTITDETDGAITPTAAMITENVDMTTIGAYLVTLSVTNSNALTTAETIVVNVSDGTTVINAAWLLTDVANKVDNLYTLQDVVIISKGQYGDEGFVFDGTNFIYVDAYGTTQSEAFIDANIGDTVTITGQLSVLYDYKYYISDVVYFEVTEEDDGEAFDMDSICIDVTAAELAALVENNNTYINCYDVSGTVVEELYEGDTFYNLADTTDATKYFIGYSLTPPLPKEEFDLNTGENVTVRMFLQYYRSDRAHFGYYWILDVLDPVVSVDISYIVDNRAEGDEVLLKDVIVTSKTSDDYGMYVTDGTNFIYVNAFGTDFADAVLDLAVGDTINVRGLYAYNYTYKMEINELLHVELVSEGDGTFDFTGLCQAVTVSELFAIKDTNAAFINCYDVTGVTWLEDGQYMNFTDIVNTSEYFIAYGYAPDAPKSDFDALGDGNETTVRMFYFRYRDDKSHGGYYWMLDVLNSENPVISLTGESLFIPQGSSEPDWTTYFTVEDPQDGAITVTSAMITEDVDTTTIGNYNVTITVTDSESNASTKTIAIAVADPATIDIPWIVTNAAAGQSFTFEDVTVVSKTSDDVGFYIYDGEYFFYVNAYGTSLEDEAADLVEGDIVTLTGEIYLSYIYKKELELTALTLETASTGPFDYTGLCTTVTVSELFAIKDDGMTFVNCYDVTGTTWLEAGTYMNFMDTVNTTEYFIAYGYAAAEPKAEFDALGDANDTTVRMFHFRYRDDKTHGGYYWILDIVSSDKPMITETGGNLLLPEGSTEPDWTTYFTVTDQVDGDITVTSAMITEDVDMTTAGDYTVTISVTDSDSNTATKTLNITVVDPATIDIPWIVTNAQEGQVFTFTTVTVVSKTKDDVGFYIYDGEYFFYVNAYGTTLETEAEALVEGDVVTLSGEIYLSYDYKKELELTALSVDTASTGPFDFTGTCTAVTASELFAIKDDGMTFVNCYDVTGTTWLESGSYMNFTDTVNTTEYFIAYGYAPTGPKDEFDTLGDANDATVRMFFFRYRDDKSHGGYYWMLDVLSYESPVIIETGEALLLPQDATEPDWTTYFEITDFDDGAIAVTTGMITESVDMTTAGDYTVTISVTDSDSNTATKDITISVVDPATIDIPWIIDNGLAGQEFTFTNATVVSKTSDDYGFYIYDGEYFFYVNAYGTASASDALSLVEGDIITVVGTLDIDYDYKKLLEPTSITLNTASTGAFDFTGLCTTVTVSELFAIKDQGMTFVNCYEVSGTVWVESGSYYNMMDTTNNGEYFIGYGYAPDAPQAVFEALSDGDTFTVRMFYFRYRDDRSHGGYYWIDEVLPTS